jgi:tetratricopeptide (TPR) repeat protein
MQENIFSKLLKFILPLAALYFLYRFGFLYGLAGTVGFIVYLVYKRKIGIYATIGKLSYAKGDMDKAIKWYRKAASMQGASPDIIISYCYLLLKKGQTDESERILDDFMRRLSISEDKRNLAKSIKALITWKKGNLDQAIEMLEEVIKNLETSNIYGSLGYLLILKGDLDRALEFNLKAYEYNNSHDVILDNLGQTYYLRGEYEKSVEIYEKLMGKNPKPTFPEAYYNYGLLLLATGKREEALEKMKQALNYNISFLSTIDKDEIRKKINEIEGETTSMEVTDEQ